MDFAYICFWKPQNNPRFFAFTYQTFNYYGQNDNPLG